jgi:hypothetical protein
MVSENGVTLNFGCPCNWANTILEYVSEKVMLSHFNSLTGNHCDELTITLG